MDKCIANSSLAHTVGNVTSLFTEYIKSLFPKNYFRHVHIATRMAYREQKREENSKYEFIKKTKPILIVRPRIDIDSEDIFLTNSMFTTNLWGTQIIDGLNTNNLLPFFLDRERGCQITYMLGRIRVLFDFTIMVDTEYEQINQYSYLHTLFTTNRFYRLNSALEYYIPSNLLELVSAYSGIPIMNDSGRPREFLHYLMAHSNKYITFKERPSSSTKDFFMYYPLSIDYVVTDFSKDDVNKKSWAVHSSNINFSIMAEFNTTQLYQFESDRPRPTQTEIDFNIKPGNADGINIIPHFTIDNLFDSTKLPNGFDLFYSQMFETDPNNHLKKDNLQLSDLFDRTNAKDIIEWHKNTGINNKVFLAFIIMCNNEMLVENKDYVVNWDTDLSIDILNSNADATYRLNIFVNNLYINQLMDNYGENGVFHDYTHHYEQDVAPVTNSSDIRSDTDIGIR